MVYNAESPPYFFTFDTDNFDAIIKPPGNQKITDNISLTFGRSGIVGKNGVQFVFNIGDIILADTNVQFIPRPDTILYTNTEQLNQVTRSLTFHLDNQSDLYFTNFYYTVNPEIADSALTNDDAVTFRAELVNAVTNTVEGTFDEITYTKNNLDKYDNINYQVDCSGIDDGDYYLRLVTSVVGEASYNLANVQNDNPGLDKKNYHNVDFKGNEIPTTYDLSQNYPNPFNPTTKISYVLPYISSVELVVYDMLGRQVKNFNLSSQPSGTQSITWDGTNNYNSPVSSGVYLYRINIESLENNKTFVKTSKLILLK
jgi:hypothetical protein